MPVQQKTETKPRLGKDEVELLEREFQKNPKPTTNTKKQFAEQMSVDLSRINNWFQNRRAKRKQEKKQEAYEAGQREAMGYTDDDSSDFFNPCAVYDEGSVASVPQQSYSLISGPPPATAPYNPRYSDPTEASLESLQRTMAAAQAISQQEFHEGFIRPNDNLPHFGGPLVIHSGPSVDRARFPAANSVPRFENTLYSDTPSLLPYEAPHSVDSFSPSPVMNDTPTMFTGFPMASEPATMSPQMMTAFPSQLLSLASSQTPEDSSGSTLADDAHSTENSLSPPASGSFRSPPPPMDIAARRKKVQHRPAALGMDTIRSRPQLGPRTVSQAESFRRPLASPSSSPMRRIASAGGNNAVMSGRIYKAGIRSAQRSPIDAKFLTDVMERNYHTTPQALSLTAGSSLNSSLAPPTPMSPLEMTVRSSTNGSSSSPESHMNYMFNGSGQDLLQSDGDVNLTSPPDTPAPNMWFMSSNEWKYNMNDEPLFTPAHDEFPTQFHMDMQTPAYLSASQPVTPAFGEFNQNLMFPNDSPQYTLGSSANAEYTFPDSLQQCASGFVPGSSPSQKQKTFQFSNSTPADFTEK
ncbi:hypothetical protein BP6252_00904 [Coleophoma cylindrospora]|uniref:Homeobox domain-containing protein n=1 Tax=Coleophoma cylindrospora TaxID=1849047 RepID=A0A3D8SRF2_9HELO|nr:hypothetical protein BP6252_00904 [Coleophoma cylindrospora]